MSKYLKLEARGVSTKPMSVTMKPLNYYFRADSPAYNSIPTYLIGLGVGTQPTPPSLFWNPLDRSGVLDLGISHVRQWTDIPELQGYDLSRIPKYGAQGGLPPISSPETVALFRRYYDNCMNPCKIPDYVYKHMKRKYSQADLKPMTYREVVDRAIEKGRYDTQGGAPWFLAKKKTIEEGIALAQSGGLGDRDVVVAGERAIRQGLRFIYMASQSTSLRELRWIIPMQEWMRDNLPQYAALKGQAEVEKSITPWGSSSASIFLSGDYSKMDTTCGVQQYLAFYEITKWMWPKKLWSEYRRDLLHAINVPAIVGCVKTPGMTATKSSPATQKKWDVVVVTGTHSNQSGDAWNQTLEDILSDSVHTQLHLEGYEDEWQLIGDDSIGRMTPQHTQDEIATRFAEVSSLRGMVANVEKQFVSETSFKYLQRYYCPESYHHNHWYGAYPLVLALNSAKNPERDNITGYAREREMQSVRYISIVENMSGHPKFEDAIELFLAGDPNHLGVGDPKLWEDDALYQSMRDKGQLSSASVAMKYPPKLREFKTVQYLMRR